jgi:hypothetical protein
MLDLKGVFDEESREALLACNTSAAMRSVVIKRLG